MADQSVDAAARVREVLDDLSSAIRAAAPITEKGAQGIDAALAQVKTSSEKPAELSGIVNETPSAHRQMDAAVAPQNAGIAHSFQAVTDQNLMMSDAVERLRARPIDP